MDKTLIRTSEHIYGFLLKLYPKRFRQEFGQEMQYVFSEYLTDAYTVSGEQGVVTLWVRTLIDTLKSLVIEHVANNQGGKAMKTNTTSLTTSIARVALVTTLILMIPFLGMQFSNEVDWNVADFVIMGTLISSTGLLIELVLRKVTSFQYRALLVLGLIGVLLLIWIELAVGLFGSPFAGS